jgi:hypothetical protein
LLVFVDGNTEAKRLGGGVDGNAEAENRLD